MTKWRTALHHQKPFGVWDWWKWSASVCKLGLQPHLWIDLFVTVTLLATIWILGLRTFLIVIWSALLDLSCIYPSNWTLNIPFFFPSQFSYIFFQHLPSGSAPALPSPLPPKQSITNVLSPCMTNKKNMSNNLELCALFPRLILSSSGHARGADLWISSTSRASFVNKVFEIPSGLAL